MLNSKFPIIKIIESTSFNKPSFEQPHPITQEGGKGTQKIWRFKNGYGVSAVRFEIPNVFNLRRTEKIGSYGINEGLWEIAVLKWNKNDEWEIDYTTKITPDVIGHLSEKQVEKYLEKVKKLKEKLKK